MDNIENTPEWKKISEGLLRPVKTSPSEAFVTRVMAHVEEAESIKTPSFINWALPLTGLAAAAVVLFVFLVSPQTGTDADSLLSINGSQNSSNTLLLDDLLET